MVQNTSGGLLGPVLSSPFLKSDHMSTLMLCWEETPLYLQNVFLHETPQGSFLHTSVLFTSCPDCTHHLVCGHPGSQEPCTLPEMPLQGTQAVGLLPSCAEPLNP